MKLHYAIPVALGILALSAYQARAIDPARPNAPAPKSRPRASMSEPAVQG